MIKKTMQRYLVGETVAELESSGISSQLSITLILSFPITLFNTFINLPLHSEDGVQHAAGT